MREYGLLGGGAAAAAAVPQVGDFEVFYSTPGALGRQRPGWPKEWGGAGGRGMTGPVSRP
jgi:hypothetical protein